MSVSLPAEIQEVITSLQLLSSLGKKSATKITLDYILSTSENQKAIVNSLQKSLENIKFCPQCHYLSDGGLCVICKNTNRTQNIICLVEKVTDIISLENTEVYYGLYHVLNNLISPIDNKFEEDTTLIELVNQRLPKLCLKHEFVELILFFKQGFNAQTTTAFLTQSLNTQPYRNQIKITQMAQGLPVNYNPEKLDIATLTKALNARTDINN